jgi:hypothetical protein
VSIRAVTRRRVLAVAAAVLGAVPVVSVVDTQLSRAPVTQGRAYAVLVEGTPVGEGSGEVLGLSVYNGVRRLVDVPAYLRDRGPVLPSRPAVRDAPFRLGPDEPSSDISRSSDAAFVVASVAAGAPTSRPASPRVELQRSGVAHQVLGLKAQHPTPGPEPSSWAAAERPPEVPVVRTPVTRPRLSVPPSTDGSSAALAHAIAYLEHLSPTDLLQGRRVAATGTVGVDGEVQAVAGVEAKYRAALDAGAQVLFVPRANLDAFLAAAGRYRRPGADLVVVAVDTFADVATWLCGRRPGCP